MSPLSLAPKCRGKCTAAIGCSGANWQVVSKLSARHREDSSCAAAVAADPQIRPSGRHRPPRSRWIRPVVAHDREHRARPVRVADVALLPFPPMVALRAIMYEQFHAPCDRGLELDRDHRAQPLGGSRSRAADLEAPPNVLVVGLQPWVDSLGRERFQRGAVHALRPLPAPSHVGEHESDRALHRLGAREDGLARAVPPEPDQIRRDDRAGLTQQRDGVQSRSLSFLSPRIARAFAHCAISCNIMSLVRSALPSPAASRSGSAADQFRAGPVHPPFHAVSGAWRLPRPSRSTTSLRLFRSSPVKRQMNQPCG